MPGVVDLAILLPWISAVNGNRLFVKIIHERDSSSRQFSLYPSNCSTESMPATVKMPLRSLIAVNFTDVEQSVPFVFARAGNYTEQLHGLHNFSTEAGQEHWLTVPSNYGRMWRSV